MTERTVVPARGLLGRLSDLAADLVAMAHTRLDLLSTDLEEGRKHLVSVAVASLLALFLLGVGVVLTAVLLVVIFWDTHRVLILALQAAVFLILGLAAANRARVLTSTGPRPFASTMAELVKDRAELVSHS